LSYVDFLTSFCPCWLCLSGREYGNKMMQYSFLSHLHSHLDPHFDDVVFSRSSFGCTF
jgi:hypothetical protein